MLARYSRIWICITVFFYAGNYFFTVNLVRLNHRCNRCHSLREVNGGFKSDVLALVLFPAPVTRNYAITWTD